jgi:PAS domain S-box-containing protein
MARVVGAERIDGLLAVDLDTRIVDEVDMAVIAVDPGGVVLRWNRHAEQIYGWPATEAVGHTLQELAIAPEDARFAQRVMRRVSRGTSWTGDFPIRRKDGQARVLHAKIVPFYETGELVAMVGFSADVTEARRLEAERARNEEELEYLARASTILDSSLDLHVTLQQLAELAVPFIGDGCMVDVRRDDGTIERFALAAVDDGLREGFERLRRHPIDPAGDHPIARAMRSGQVQLPEDINSEDRTPWAGTAEHLEDLQRFPGRLGMVAPIRAGDRLLGTLSIALSPDRADFGPREVALVKELARRASTALENARLFTERTYVAETLQRSLLPATLPSVEGFDIAAIYRPAMGGTEVGGDFYDVFETCGAGWGVAIADVCGKGVEAATVTALARYTLRAAALHHSAPAVMLDTVNDALLKTFHGDQFCTVALGVVETNGRSASMRMTLGGHPSPMVLRAGGEVIEDVGAPGSLLGVMEHPEWHEVPVSLEPGDTLLFYTDGATETKTERGRLGAERLAGILARCAGLNAMEVVSRVESEIGLRRSDDEVDDLALLAMRFAGAP